MTWTDFQAMLAGLGEEPSFALIAFLVGLLIGVFVGLYARWRSAEAKDPVWPDSGDTHAGLWHRRHDARDAMAGLTWLDPSPHRTHAFPPSQPPAPGATDRKRVRAGSSVAHLKPSYDSSRRAAPKA